MVCRMPTIVGVCTSCGARIERPSRVDATVEITCLECCTRAMRLKEKFTDEERRVLKLLAWNLLEQEAKAKAV